MKHGFYKLDEFTISIITGILFLLCFGESYAQQLTLSKSGPVNGNPGDAVSYTINYSNKSAATINSIVIKDTLPQQFTYISQSSSPAISFISLFNGVLTWNIASLAKGSSGTITVNGKFGLLGSVSYSLYDPAGYYVTTGGVSSPNKIINNASISGALATPVYTSVTSDVPQYCGSSISPPTQNGYVKKSTGTIITYTYTLTNTGNINDKYNLTSSYSGDVMGTAFLNMANNPITATTWIIPGGTFQFQLQLTVGSGPPNVTNVTTIVATSVVCGSVSSANAITFEYNGNSPPPPNSNDLIISKFAFPFGTVVEPATILYTISVFNNVSSGNKPADNVFITDELPANTTVVAGSDFPSATVVGQTVTWNVGTIASNGIYICFIEVTTSCNSVPSVINRAYVTSTPLDVDTTNNHVTVTTSVIDNVFPVARCQNATLTLDATGNATLSPSLVDNGSSDNCGTVNLSVSPNTFNCSNIGNNNVTLTVTDGSGNVSTCNAVVTVTGNAMPTIITQPVNASVCVGSNTSFNVNATGSSLTYQWKVNTGSGFVNVVNGATYSGATTATLNITGATLSMNGYTYECVVTANCGSSSSVTTSIVTLTVNALPVPTIAGPSSVCVNSTGNVYTTQAGMFAYNWTVSAGGTITAGGTAASNTVTVTWNTVGAQTVKVNYTNANGCTASSQTTFNVTVNALPVPTLAGPTPVCQNSTGNVYTTQVGMTGYVWTVSAGGTITAGGTAASNTVTIIWNTVGAQTVKVNYTNANGCTAVAPVTFNVTVNVAPVPTLAGPSSVCVNTAGNVYTTQAGMTGYTWTVSAGGTITAGGTAASSSVTVTWTAAGAQTVSVNYTNASGCPAAAPVVYNVTVNALPVPTVAGPASVCVNSAGNVYTTQAGMSAYNWTVSAGGTITAGGTAASSSITVTWNTVGAQTVKVNYTNANGCTAASQTTYNVTVNALPVPTLAGPNPVCLNSTGNVYTTQAGMSAYNWTVSAGGTITAGGTAASNTVTITWNTVGAQTVKVNYTNANGCTAVSQTTFNVIVNVLPAPTLAGPASVCVNTAGNVYATQAGMTNYIWAVSAGGSITAGGTAASNTVTITWNTVGAQTVKVNYTNANGCTAASQTTYNVTVNALPVPTIAGPASVCVNSVGNVYTTQAGMTAYNWTVSAGGTITAGGTASSSTITVTWTTAGAQTVSVNYANANGCTAAAPVVFNVTVNALPTPTIVGPTPVCINSTNNVYTTQAGMTNYIWAVSAGGSITAGGTATSNTVTVTWNASGAQSVSINYSNGNGCTASASVVFPVTVNPKPVTSTIYHN
jgi:uncharacterized repeat protein (TIGR01451 family)